MMPAIGCQVKQMMEDLAKVVVDLKEDASAFTGELGILGKGKQWKSAGDGKTRPGVLEWK